MGLTKSVILLFMVASIACALLAMSLSLIAGLSIIITIPGFVVAGFFAFKYAMFDRTRAREEEHKRNRKRNKR